MLSSVGQHAPTRPAQSGYPPQSRVSPPPSPPPPAPFASVVEGAFGFDAGGEEEDGDGVDGDGGECLDGVGVPALGEVSVETCWTAPQQARYAPCWVGQHAPSSEEHLFLTLTDADTGGSRAWVYLVGCGD